MIGRIASVSVWGVAAAQLGAVALFAGLSLDGDTLGIARGMAALLAVPVLALTAPAMLLLRKGYPRAAFGLALASLATSVIAWRGA